MRGVVKGPQEALRITSALVGGALLLLALGSGCSSGAQTSPSPITVPSLSQDQLQRAKLNAEIDSIQSTTAQQGTATAQWLRWAPFLTVLVAAGTLAAAVMRQAQEAQGNRQREQDEKQSERHRRQDATISDTVQNLGSENARLRLNAAAALTPVLRSPPTEATALGLLTVLVANLRTERDPDVLDVLVDDLEMALVSLRESRDLPAHLDLTRTQIRRLRLPVMDLNAVDLAFGACRDSDLSGCTLRRLRAFGADLSRTHFNKANLHEARLNWAICDGAKFNDARLVSATFKDASLVGTQFQQAHLQGAHFESAQCFGAAFTEADVADTWFCNGHGDRATKFDRSALLSLHHAHHWRSAHLSKQDRAWLEAQPA